MVNLNHKLMQRNRLDPHFLLWQIYPRPIHDED
jgi:hypothetical protein